MVTIFRIVSGIIISFFIIIIIQQKMTDYLDSQFESSMKNEKVLSEKTFQNSPKADAQDAEAEKKRELREQRETLIEQNKQAAEKLADNLIRLSDGVKSKINTFYQLNSALPKYVSDLQCKDGEICAYSQSNGYFFVKHEQNWVAIRPTIKNNFILYDCFTSLDIHHINYEKQKSVCTSTVQSPMPEPIKPSFNCKSASNFVEKAICGSDRLAELDLELDKEYRAQLSKNHDQSSILRQDQIDFIKFRNSECHDAECIEEMTRKRVFRLSMHSLESET